MIEIQRSLVDLVLFSRSSMGEQDLPRQHRALRGERNSIIPENRGSPSARGPFPSFLSSFYQPPASSRTARLAAAHGIPHFLYPPAFLTTPLFAPVAAAPAERIRAAGRSNPGKFSHANFFLPARNTIDIDFLHLQDAEFYVN